MKTIILAGGLGSRMREETEYKPKPMVEIGERPILWHIIKNYNSYNFNEFIVMTILVDLLFEYCSSISTKVRNTKEFVCVLLILRASFN